MSIDFLTNGDDDEVNFPRSAVVYLTVDEALDKFDEILTDEEKEALKDLKTYLEG